mgnify:CR=1 FL=1
MLCNRMKQFREYNKLDCKLVAEVLGISENEYKDFENNKALPTIDIITTLSKFYKVTVDEFYAVIVIRIMACRNHDSAVKAVCSCNISNGGCCCHVEKICIRA